jgi:hypothetical protein
MNSVTLQLPDTVMRRAQQAAAALHHPLEEVLADLLAATLPDVERAPESLRAELARMTWLSDTELWALARSQIDEAQQAQLQALATAQTERALTPNEQATLEDLRQAYGRVTLLKARAFALLGLRGGRPLLADN